MCASCDNFRERGSRTVTFADAKNRFSNRVADYLRYRPHYPSGVIDLMRAQCHLFPTHVIADIGSGTGFLSELFLKNDNPVYGIEPNREMRSAGEEYLAAYPRFTSVEGSAEATTLADSSVDVVTAGQAFHWFEPNAARREFTRILRPFGWIAIIWNDRNIATTGFAHAYEDLLLRFGTDYARVKDSYPRAEDIRAFFYHNNFATRELPNRQVFDLDGLKGRLRSSSYVPPQDHPNFAPMMAELDKLFAANQQDSHVSLEYSTVVYLGQLRPDHTALAPGSVPS